MTRQDFIFRNAGEIAERRNRAARRMQSAEARRTFIALFASIKGLLSRPRTTELTKRSRNA